MLGDPDPRVAPDVDLESMRAADPGAPDDRLANRLAWITGLRLAFLTLLLVATGFFYLRGELAVYPESQTILVATISAGSMRLVSAPTATSTSSS